MRFASLGHQWRHTTSLVCLNLHCYIPHVLKLYINAKQVKSHSTCLKSSCFWNLVQRSIESHIYGFASWLFLSSNVANSAYMNQTKESLYIMKIPPVESSLSEPQSCIYNITPCHPYDLPSVNHIHSIGRAYTFLIYKILHMQPLNVKINFKNLLNYNKSTQTHKPNHSAIPKLPWPVDVWNSEPPSKIHLVRYLSNDLVAMSLADTCLLRNANLPTKSSSILHDSTIGLSNANPVDSPTSIVHLHAAPYATWASGGTSAPPFRR